MTSHLRHAYRQIRDRSSPHPESASAPVGRTAGDIVNMMAAALPTVGEVTVLTEDNDPNNLIGRPTGYTSTALLHDKRLTGAQDFGVSVGSHHRSLRH